MEVSGYQQLFGYNSSKYLILCSTEANLYRFGITCRAAKHFLIYKFVEFKTKIHIRMQKAAFKF